VQYSAVEWTRPKVAIRSIVAPAPQPEPASCLKGETHDVNQGFSSKILGTRHGPQKCMSKFHIIRGVLSRAVESESRSRKEFQPEESES